MPLIKNITAISYSSQDPKHPLSALLKGTGAWLCSPDDRSGRLSADLQLDRALSISYIDVGNHNSVTLSVEVSRSCSSNGTMSVLLPTVALMTPQEFRGQHPNCKAVRMFRAEDLDKRALKEQWDRVRVTCCQPFKRGVPFGLSFLKLYTSEVLQPTTVLPPPPSAVSPLVTSLTNAANGLANIVTAESDSCLQSKLESKKKTPVGKSVLSDEHILQRLRNISPSHASLRKNPMSPGFNQSKNSSKNPQPLANNLKELEHKIPSIQNPFNASQAKENHVRGASNTNKNSSGSPHSAAKRFRSALEKLCANQASVSPTVVAKQNFIKKFGSSTGGGPPAEGGGDGRPPVSVAESSGPSAGGGAAAASSKAEFEYEALEFLIALNLQKDQILQLKVADVRVQFEAQRGEPLTRPLRLCFKNLALDYCARRLDTLDSESKPPVVSGSRLTASTARLADPSSSSAFNSRASPAGSGPNISLAGSEKNISCAGSPSGRLPAVSSGDSPSAFIGSSSVSGVGRRAGITDTPSGTGGGGSRKWIGSGISNTPERSGSGQEVVIANGDCDVPEVCGDVSRVGSGRKFFFKKLEFESPSTTSQSSPINGAKPLRFSRAASKSPMPFYDDYDSPQASPVAGELKSNSIKISPKVRGSTKKRKKEEPKPLADGEWLKSKKVRIHVSSSPRNAARKGESSDDDVVEMVELDDSNERQSNHKTNNSLFQNNNGWLKKSKPSTMHENNSREFSRELSKLVSTEDVDMTRQVRPTSQRRAAAHDSSACAGSTDTTTRGTDTADVSEGTSCRDNRAQPTSAEGFRLGATPANKFGLRRQQEVEEESVECPLCSRLFQSSLIEEHAATCGHSDGLRATDVGAAGTSDIEIKADTCEECPVCGEQLEGEEYAQHVPNCADRHFEV